MKTQKKYYTEKDIIKEIDDAKARKEQEALRAERLDKEANELFTWINANDGLRNTEPYKETFQQATNARTEASRLRKHQSSFLVKLERLKRTLAAFRTEPMAFAERAVISQ